MKVFKVTGGPHAPAEARRELATAIAGDLSPETEQCARLLVTELVTNAVVHGGVDADEAITVKATVGHQALSAAVCHSGPTFARPPGELDLDTPGGLGLYLVDQLSDSWGIESNALTCVWFRLTR